MAWSAKTTLTGFSVALNETTNSDTDFTVPGHFSEWVKLDGGESAILQVESTFEASGSDMLFRIITTLDDSDEHTDTIAFISGALPFVALVTQRWSIPVVGPYKFRVEVRKGGTSAGSYIPNVYMRKQNGSVVPELKKQLVLTAGSAQLEATGSVLTVNQTQADGTMELRDTDGTTVLPWPTGLVVTWTAAGSGTDIGTYSINIDPVSVTVKLNDTDVKGDYDLVLNQGTLTIREAVDPPGGSAFPVMWDNYLTRVINALPQNFTYIANFSQGYFDHPVSINKSPVYYDPGKFLFELSELVWPTVIPNLEEYALLSNRILHAYYENYNEFDGFVKFPHGLAYRYHNTGDQWCKDALIYLYQKKAINKIDPSDEYVGYSREVSYALACLVASMKADIDQFNVYLRMNHILDMCISHLNQWYTKEMYTPSGKNPITYRNPFMIGLTMMALIEYYERIHPDNRIPAAIQPMLDDVWNIEWEIITSENNEGNFTNGYGGFWYQSDLIDGQWVPNPNFMGSTPDLNGDENMNLAGAYAWYANWLIDNIPNSEQQAQSYMDKAILAWQGFVVNGNMVGYEGQPWQFNRYVNEFIREYRKYYGATCGSSTINMCNIDSCSLNGGNWTGERCQHTTITVPVSPVYEPEIPEPEIIPGTKFYWGMESAVTSDGVRSEIGDILIRFSSYPMVLIEDGVVGNAQRQPGNQACYYIDANVLNGIKHGTIRLYLRRPVSSVDAGTSYGDFFRTSSGPYARINGTTISLNIQDGNSKMHTASATVSWEANRWYLYEFSWNATTGLVEIKIDGTVVASNTSTAWNAILYDGTGKIFYIGYQQPIGDFDEYYIIDHDLAE